MKILNVTLTKECAMLICSNGKTITITPNDIRSQFLTDIVIPTIFKEGFYRIKGDTFLTDECITKVLKESTVPADKIIPLAQEAVYSGNTKGLKLFIKRLNAVNKERHFSAQSCIDFVANNDLPITPEGNILGYKWLDKSNGEWVDCHTGKIMQAAGTIVEMDIKAVDPDRAQDCSYGLHVASRKYVSRFYGDGVGIVLVRPEDIISVPESDTAKVRCCRYKLLFVYDKDSKEGRDIISGALMDKTISDWVNTAETVPSIERVILKGRTQNYTVIPLDPEEKKVSSNNLKTKQIKKDKKRKFDPTKQMFSSFDRKHCLDLIEAFNKQGFLSGLDLEYLRHYRKQRKQSFARLFGDLWNRKIDKYEKEN